MECLVDLIHQNLNDPGTSWGIGTFGAIGEFFLDADEDHVLSLHETGGNIVTGRGALAIRLRPEARLLPYEQLSKRRHLWLQGANFCLPDTLAKVRACSVLTELGPDEQAVREEDRDAILFDLGLSTPTLSACIRTGDAELIAVLRANEGRSVFEPGNPAMKAIIKISPHRVFRSQLGRVEVYQYIPIPGKGETSPEGPHTHILPKLLQSGKTHSANVPMLKGHLPCLTMYPASPLQDKLGNDRAFDRSAHKAFQLLMEQFGPAEIIKLKRQMKEAVSQGRRPEDFPATDRWSRATVRVTLRQLLAELGDNRNVHAWQDYFEPAGEAQATDNRCH